MKGLSVSVILGHIVTSSVKLHQEAPIVLHEMI